MNRKTGSTTLVLLTCFGLVFGTVAEAETLGVPSQYATIQAAIDASSDGDIIAIAPGTYSGVGNRDISMRNKTICIKGTGGRDVTVVDCEGSPSDPHYGFRFLDQETPETVISGLTIINAYVDDDFAAAIDAVHFAYGSRGTVDNCRVAHCSRPGGTIVSGHLNISNTIIEECEAAVILYVQHGQVENVDVRNNVAGIAVDISGIDPQLSDSRITGNTATALFCGADVSGLVERTLIAGNSFGVYAGNPASSGLVLRECSIVGSRFDAIEGGQFGEVYMERCVLWGNRSLGTAGFETEWVLDCCLFPAGEPLGDGFTLVGEQTHDDPLFCDERDWSMAPTSEGDYSVSAGSPCLPDGNACEMPLGAYGLGECEPASVPADDPTIASFTIVSPLPATGRLTFRLASSSHGDARLYDLNGRQLASRSFVPAGSHNEVTWQLATLGLKTGVYFLRVEQARGQLLGVQKFVWLDR